MSPHPGADAWWSAVRATGPRALCLPDVSCQFAAFSGHVLTDLGLRREHVHLLGTVGVFGTTVSEGKGRVVSGHHLDLRSHPLDLLSPQADVARGFRRGGVRRFRRLRLESLEVHVISTVGKDPRRPIGVGSRVICQHRTAGHVSNGRRLATTLTQVGTRCTSEPRVRSSPSRVPAWLVFARGRCRRRRGQPCAPLAGM